MTDKKELPEHTSSRRPYRGSIAENQEKITG